MASASLIMFLGFATFINVAVILWKWRKGLETNAMIDAGVLAGIFWLFNGTISALAIGTTASMFFSIYLLFIPFEEEENHENS